MGVLGALARASKRVLAAYGKDALLRGAPAGKVAIIREAFDAPGSLDDANDNHVVRRLVACIGSEFSPRVNDVLEHPDGRYLLDRLIEDDGYVQHYVVVPAPAP